MIDHAPRAVDGSPRLSAVGPTVNGHRVPGLATGKPPKAAATVTQSVFHSFRPSFLCAPRVLQPGV